MMKLILVFMGVIGVLPAMSLVDMRTANYSTTWTDLEVPGSGYDLKVVRAYNSRSLFNGMFGFGWCSDFETSIEIMPEGSLKLRECGSGQTTFYSPNEITRAEVDATINQIIAKMKEKKLVGTSDEAVANLRKTLFDDNYQRSERAKEFGLKIKIKDGTKFLANGKEVESIQLGKEYYTRNLLDGTTQRFNLDGKLLAIYDKNNNFLKFKYEKALLKEIEDNHGRKLYFKFYTNKKVKEIVGPNGSRAEYKFSNQDDLVWIKNAWSNIYTYQYDDLHNLVKATWPDKSFIALKYDNKRDWVIGFTDRSKCDETYVYDFAKADPDKHYWATVKKVCGKETLANNRYEFWHKQKTDGTFYLSRLLTEVDGNTTDIQYDDGFGKPIFIRRNTERFTFDYYPDGQIKSKTSNNAKSVFTWDTETKRLNKVQVSFTNAKGEKIGTKQTDFKYDSKGNIIFAQNSDGQSVTLTYDDRGRITTILDQAKKVVKLEYAERSTKPSVVARPGLGSIKISYKSNGELEKADPKEGGPSVALQIASTFNNLLDVIAPATQDFYL